MILPAAGYRIVGLKIKTHKEVEVEVEELEDLVNKQVDDHKQLRGGIHFVQKIPRNQQGKILRSQLLEHLSSVTDP